MQKFKLSKENQNDIVGRINKFMESCKKEGTICFGYTNKKDVRKITKFFNFRIYQKATCGDVNIEDDGVYMFVPNHRVHKLEYGTNIYFNGGNMLCIQLLSGNGYKRSKMVFYRTRSLPTTLTYHSRMLRLLMSSSIYGISGITPSSEKIKDSIDSLMGYIGDQLELSTMSRGEDLIKPCNYNNESSMQKVILTKQNAEDTVNKISNFFKLCNDSKYVTILYIKDGTRFARSSSFLSVHMLDTGEIGIIGLHADPYNIHMIEVFDIGSTIYFDGDKGVILSAKDDDIKYIVSRGITFNDLSLKSNNSL